MTENGLEARAYFSYISISKKSIRRYREKADHLREMAKSCTPRITNMPGPATKNLHSMADKIDMAVYYDCMADRLEKELSTVTSTFHSSIQSIQKQEYREILTKRYIDHMSWATIADQVGYDVRSVQRINRRCLSSIQFPKLPQFPDHDEYRLPGCTPK